MYKERIKKIASLIRFICAIQFMLATTACSYDPLTITGRVVDESGNSLNNVSVWACYSGWGWGEAGYLVWDKSYCSEITQTDLDGYYIITFKGPASSRLWAKKEGWVQTKDFNTTHSRIVLTKSEDHSARLRTEAKQRDLEQRRRRAEESETEYYCRVILPEIQSVNLNYQGEILAITPTLLVKDAQSDALFTVRGSFIAVNTFSDELVIKINSEAQGSNFSLKPVEASCGLDVHFIGGNISGLNAWPDARVEILVPSISTMFDMQLWSHPALQ